MTQKANLIGGRELQQLRAENPMLANLLRRIVGAINNVSETVGVSTTGTLPAPSPIGNLNVKAAGGIAHVTIEDTAPVTKTHENFVEYDTDPNFPNPHVAHLGVSRGVFLSLPAKDDGGTAQNWHFRAYKQQPGSMPSEPVYYGGLAPTAVNVGGTTQLTPLPSTGSGTASPTGGQGGWGRGKVQERPAVAPKRNVK